MLQSRVLFSFHFYSISFHVLYFISYPVSHNMSCISFYVLYLISCPVSHYMSCISFHVLYLISCTVFHFLFCLSYHVQYLIFVNYYISCVSFQYFTSYHVHVFHVLYSVSCKVFQFMYCHTFHVLYLLSCQFRMLSVHGIYLLLIIHYFFQEGTFFFFHSEAEVFSDESKNTLPHFKSIRVVCILYFSVKSFSFSFIFRKVFNMYLPNFVQRLLSELKNLNQLQLYIISLITADACFIIMLSLVRIAFSLMFCT